MISVLVPTRGRRDGLIRTIQSIRATQTSPVEVVCYIDDDDPTDYLSIREAVSWITGPRIVLSNIWNKCAELAVGEILCQGNDDIVFQTRGWDTIVERAFADSRDKILMVHGSDGSSSGLGSAIGEFGPHPFLHRKWVETLGYFTPPWFSSDYGDTWINDLANAVGRRRHLPFVIEHMHFAFGKAGMDQTTNERLTRHSDDNVPVLYNDLAPLRAMDIEKLRVVMQ